MKYLTEEELSIIADKLLESPTRETLRELSEEYSLENSLNDSESVQIPESVSKPQSLENQGLDIPNSETSEILSPEITNNENNLIEQAPSLPKPDLNSEISIQGPSLSEEQTPESPTIEVPSIENVGFQPVESQVPIQGGDIALGNAVPFNGNLFEQPNLSPASTMMQTTDNFTGNISESSIPVGDTPFFGPADKTQVNNPIPGIDSNQTYVGPTMFGQIQTDYQRAA